MGEFEVGEEPRWPFQSALDTHWPCSARRRDSSLSSGSIIRWREAAALL
jgi:hypothetical protein